MAAVIASWSVVAFFRVSWISASASLIGFPCFEAFCSAFFRPARTVVESTPFLLRFPRKKAASLIPIPISCSAGAFVISACVIASTLSPVSCPTLFSVSSRLPASLIGTFHAAIALCRLSIAVFASVPLSCANCRIFTLRSSSSVPVIPKRVFSSPIVVPIWSKGATICFATDPKEACRLSASSPVAPVSAVIVSRPSSTASHAA